MTSHQPAWTGMDRRDVVGRQLLRRRFHSEYEELPGMSLTPDQASRLFALPTDVCRRVFDELVDAGVLSRRWDGGQYVVSRL